MYPSYKPDCFFFIDRMYTDIDTFHSEGHTKKMQEIHPYVQKPATFLPQALVCKKSY